MSESWDMVYEEFLAECEYYGLDSRGITRTDYSYANGCGEEKGLHTSPFIWFVKVLVACQLHDIRWQKAERHTDLLLANIQFSEDLRTVCRYESQNSFMRWARYARIDKWVWLVENFGTEDYSIKRGFR